MCSVPIGHEDDITIRVKHALQHAPVIFCEDTRVTHQLLVQQGIFLKQHLIRMDQIQESQALAQFDRWIQTGDVAYVSDAGTPTISDPGAQLVAHARLTGIEVQILGGISAVSAFLAGAGKLFQGYFFGGFMPRKEGDKKRAIDTLIQSKQLGVWFESPRRIVATLDCIQRNYPPIDVVVAKELTKPYEQFFVGSATDVYHQLNRSDQRGEWIFLIDARQYQAPQTDYAKMAKQLKQMGINAAQLKPLSQLFDLNKNQLYDQFQQL